MQMEAVNAKQMECTEQEGTNPEGVRGEMCFDIRVPLQYRWSGRFVAKDGNWKHMERQLVDYELIVMEKGTLYIEDEWGQYELEEGQFLLMKPAGIQRGYRPSKCRFYWMHFMPGTEEDCGGNGQSESKRRNDDETAERESLGAKELRLPGQGTLKNADRLFVLLKQLQDSDLRYMNPLYNGYLATAILCEIANQLGADPSEKGGDGLQEKVDDYLFQHMDRSLSVGDLAKAFGYHEKYFSAIFKEKTGQSVKKYMDGRKVERAKYLLLNTDALVAEIADHLGYEDVQNFYHVFKKSTSCTPSEFRETYSKKQENNI